MEEEKQAYHAALLVLSQVWQKHQRHKKLSVVGVTSTLLSGIRFEVHRLTGSWEKSFGNRIASRNRRGIWKLLLVALPIVEKAEPCAQLRFRALAGFLSARQFLYMGSLAMLYT